jgi:hypothetical protein
MRHFQGTNRVAPNRPSAGRHEASVLFTRTRGCPAKTCVRSSNCLDRGESSVASLRAPTKGARCNVVRATGLLRRRRPVHAPNMLAGNVLGANNCRRRRPGCDPALAGYFRGTPPRSCIMEDGRQQWSTSDCQSLRGCANRPFSCSWPDELLQRRTGVSLRLSLAADCCPFRFTNALKHEWGLP